MLWRLKIVRRSSWNLWSFASNILLVLCIFSDTSSSFSLCVWSSHATLSGLLTKTVSKSSYSWWNASLSVRGSCCFCVVALKPDKGFVIDSWWVWINGNFPHWWSRLYFFLGFSMSGQLGLFQVWLIKPWTLDPKFSRQLGHQRSKSPPCMSGCPKGC
jgi:hypothetical protein